MQFGGIPVEPDLRRLREAFPKIEPDQIITYEEVAAVIGLPVGPGRFRTVTGAWRRELLRTHNFVLAVHTPGKSWRRLTEKERSQTYNGKGWQRGAKISIRHTLDMGQVDTSEFDENDRRLHDHRQRAMTAWMDGTRKTVKEIAPPKPVESLPRRTGPG